MIFKPTATGSFDADSSVVVGPRAIDLNADGAWSELIGWVVALANSGGGRIEVRCVADAESEPTSERVFLARIESVVSELAESKLGAKNRLPANLQPVRIVTDPDAPAGSGCRSAPIRGDKRICYAS
jgi:hypothetical protein